MILKSLQTLPWEPVSHNPEIRKKVLISRGAIPHINALAQSCLTSGQSTSPHRHPDMTEVYLVESGSGSIRIDNQSIPLMPGTCVAVQPGEEHSITNTQTEDLVLSYVCIETGVPSA